LGPLLSLSAILEFRKFVQRSEAIQMVLYKTIQVNIYLIGYLGVRKFMFEMCLCVKRYRVCAEVIYSRVPLIQHPWDRTGAGLSDSTCTDVSCYT